MSKIHHLSPFRYPGGKTWLVPEIISFIDNNCSIETNFIEPFAGGGVTSLVVASTGLVNSVFMSEIDEEVSSVWKILINGTDDDIQWLCNRILKFKVTTSEVISVINAKPRALKTKAFRTIVKNRMQHGGILAPGAGLLKTGERGKGLTSRWYPETLVKRIISIRKFRNKLQFEQRDAFDVINHYKDNQNAFFFVDPPYTAGGKNAGKRLYTHNEINHEKLFSILREVKGKFILTYENSSEVLELASKFGFNVRTIKMQNTHNKVIFELIISNQRCFFDEDRYNFSDSSYTR